MAQLVERTLGKGEVPSSILGISTSELFLISLWISEVFLYLYISTFLQRLAYLSHSSIFWNFQTTLIYKIT